MTPKEKAIELVDKFKFDTKQSEIINEIILGDISVVFQHHKAKQCAKLAVFEVLIALSSDKQKNKDYMNWYEQVIIEIEKL